MLSKKKPESTVDIEQHELLEKAQKWVRQKKKLFSHFVMFLIGSVLLLLANKILKYGEGYDWSIWAILVWAFLLILHTFNVFVTHRFMGKDWERQQREKLVQKQKQRISAIQKEIETDFPISNINKKKDQ
ncbi:2TM domain-containing protein [Flagellimonas sp. S3867]|uniref:2TM domain-containing protein n=1 Tax=Flagellimonas sp. S3867 TaxID=2768063 RepID=UPI0016842901|nr:2TM domain-containing protein [Flagellimonas sp. S3867]